MADKGGEKKGDARGRKDEERWAGHGPCLEKKTRWGRSAGRRRGNKAGEFAGLRGRRSQRLRWKTKVKTKVNVAFSIHKLSMLYANMCWKDKLQMKRQCCERFSPRSLGSISVIGESKH